MNRIVFIHLQSYCMSKVLNKQHMRSSVQFMHAVCRVWVHHNRTLPISSRVTAVAPFFHTTIRVTVKHCRRIWIFVYLNENIVRMKVPLTSYPIICSSSSLGYQRKQYNPDYWPLIRGIRWSMDTHHKRYVSVLPSHDIMIVILCDCWQQSHDACHYLFNQELLFFCHCT